jgi:hypothetical protein
VSRFKDELFVSKYCSTKRVISGVVSALDVQYSALMYHWHTLLSCLMLDAMYNLHIK